MFAQVTFKIIVGPIEKDRTLMYPTPTDKTRDVIIIVPVEGKTVETIIQEARSKLVFQWYDEDNDITDMRKIDEKEEELRFDLLGVYEYKPAEVKIIESPVFII